MVEPFKKGHKRKNSHLYMEQTASGSSINSFEMDHLNINKFDLVDSSNHIHNVMADDSNVNIQKVNNDLANADKSPNPAEVSNHDKLYKTNKPSSTIEISGFERENALDLESQNIEQIHNQDSQTAHNNSMPYWSWYFHKKFKHHRKRSIYILIILSLALFIFLSLSFISNYQSTGKIDAFNRHSTNNTGIVGNNPRGFTIDDIFAGKFDIPQDTFHFIRPPQKITKFESDPGLYLTTEKITKKDASSDADGSFPKIRFLAKQLYSKEFRKDLGSNSFVYNNENYLVDSIQVNYNLDRLILGSNIKQDFRHSSNGFYWLKDLESEQIQPIVLNENMHEPVELSFAKFSPNYNFIIFGHGNDIYIRHSDAKMKQVTRITEDGDENIFNGKPDWVYEEEVLASDTAIWWAPDDSMFLFAKFDTKDVHEYQFPIYTSKMAYNEIKKIKYPKVGTPNPKVSFFMVNAMNGVVTEVDLDKFENEFIFYDVQWIHNESVLFKITDRYSKSLQIIEYDLKANSLSKVRGLETKEFNGWIEKPKDMLPILPNKENGINKYGYLDIQPDKNGFNHIFYFPETSSKEGIQLTTGPWEATEILGYSYDDNLIYFSSNKISNMGQHLYGVKLNAANSNENVLTILTFQNPENIDHYYDFELSSSGSYALMKKLGPDHPETYAGPINDLLAIGNGKSAPKNIKALTHPEKFITNSKKYDMPITSYKSAEIDDGNGGKIEINYIEVKPANFDPSKKYPILVNVYGGPGSITFTKKSNMLFEESISSGLNAIILKIEPRGTGGKGWKFRSWVKDKIGYWEPRDITSVTKQYIKENIGHINQDHVVLWGWSYGGFTTLKTLEFDNGKTFKYGIAVAPVTNWLYYDSVYTERYMDTLKENGEGYNNIARINNFENFKNIQRFLLIHGTADDNVHIQNTYELIDELNLHSVKNFDLQIYPDSDHSIKFHNGQVIIFQRLYSWISDVFADKFS